MAEVKRTRTWWHCFCGKRIEIPPDHGAGEMLVCPGCGRTCEHSGPEAAEGNIIAGDTERVGFYDMARLAGEDVDPSDDDEWDTSRDDDDTTGKM